MIDVRRKLSDAQKGKHHTDETRKKISASSKNGTVEYRRKLSKAMKAAWARRKAQEVK